jgi:DivIVA domain-containing protein
LLDNIAAMGERDNERLHQASPDGESAAISPVAVHVPGDVRDVAFHTAVRGYERREVDRYVQRVNRVIAELEIARSPESAVRHALDRVGVQTSGILERARETAEEMIHTARGEAEEATERARAEGREMVAAAREETEKILADAEAQARERVEQGERELGACRDTAAETREQAEADLAAASSRADEVLAKANGEAEKIVARADAAAIERRAREQEWLDQLRAQANQEVDALGAERDVIAEERRRMVEEIHELAARLDALADHGAAQASTESVALGDSAARGDTEADVASEPAPEAPAGKPEPEA